MAVNSATSQPTQRTRWRSGSERIATVWLLLPIVCIFAVLTIVPLAQSLVYSFTDFNGYTSNYSFVGLQNYTEVFSDPSLLKGLSFTIVFAAASSALITLLAIPLAVIVNTKFFGSSFVRSLFFFLGVPSAAILGSVWQYLLSPLSSGVINSILGRFGIDPVSWLADSTLAKISVILIAVWAGVGWHATLYLAYLQSIPRDLYEQASVDGASTWQQFIHITVPQLVPAMMVSLFLLISGGLKVYELPLTLTGGGPGYATHTITQDIVLRGIGQFDYGVGSALAVLFSIVAFVVIMAYIGIFQKIARRFS